MELNPKDIEAYKIYAQILAKYGEIDNANELVKSALKNYGANGDLFYIYARLKKLNNDIDGYINNLNRALENNDTLSIQPSIVKAELDKQIKNIN